MYSSEFIERHKLHPDTIDGPACLKQLLAEMEQGLAGKGNIPMILSYLSTDIRPVAGETCCVLDAGGTNLRVAGARFDESGACTLSGIHRTAMPGTRGEMRADDFYKTLAEHVRSSGVQEKVGLCFSYNVLLERNLDGVLLSWCKEVRVPDAPGKPVGLSLQRAIGGDCKTVRVLNDSVAALLGAHHTDPDISVGLILGTGINVCYSQRRDGIPKAPRDLRGESVIISTEIGEFSGIPRSSFDEAVIACSDAPEMAHGEKQCAGAYLGELISLAWQAGAREKLLDASFLEPVTLPEISDYLAGKPTAIAEDPAAKQIAETMIRRAAKIAAILTAGPVLRSCSGGTCKMVVEGS